MARFESLTEMLRYWADAAPTDVACTFLSDGETESGAPMTYGELDRRARIVAARLLADGAHGERAVLLFAPGLDYIAAFFGCLYAGVIAVPAYPPDPNRLARTLPRIQAMVADCSAKYVLTTGDILQFAEMLFSQVEDLRTKTWIATDQIDPVVLDSVERFDEPNRSTTAFLQYTSGSTGTPKGAVLSHGNLLHNIDMCRTAMGLSRETRMVSWLPPYHDMGLIGGVLTPLATGYPVWFMSPVSFLQKPSRWLRACSRTRATISGAPNFAFDLAVLRTTAEEMEELDLSALKVLFCGAEPIRPPTITRFNETFVPRGFRTEAFYACYGLAEGTLMVTGSTPLEVTRQLAVDAAALEQRVVVPTELEGPTSKVLVACGHRVLDERVEIVDPETGTIAGPSRLGEIWVAGPSVAQGYFGREEETNRVFGAKLAGRPERYLRTGDLGFFRDGYLYIGGRLKDVIIVRGRNLYPQDLELAAEWAHSAIRPGCVATFAIEEAGEEKLVVVAEFDRRHRPDRRRGPQAPVPHPARREGSDRRVDDPIALVFVETKEAPPPSFEDAATAIRAAIASRFDVVPHAIVFIAPGSLPKTSSGKVQRRTTKQEYLEGRLETSFAEATRANVGTDDAPLSDEALALSLRTVGAGDRRETIRQHLTQLISLSVPRDRILRDAPLVTFGFDSVSVTQLHATIRTTYGVEIPLQLLFEDVTSIDTLADRIDREIRLGFADRIEPLGAVARPARIPLTFGQERLWFLHQLDPEDATYHLDAAYRLGGELDVTALERAFASLVKQNPALRMHVVLDEHGPHLCVDEAAELVLERQDLIVWGDRVREAAIDEEIAAIASRKLELTKAPLFNARLIRLGPSEHVIVLVVHHFIVDGWSSRLLFNQLARLYATVTHGGDLREPIARTVEYVDFAVWQRNWLQGAILEREADHCRSSLKGMDRILDLPTDHPRVSGQGVEAACIGSVLEPDLSNRVDAYARAEGVTPFMVLFTAFSLLLSRYSRQTDFGIGVPVANRVHLEMDDVLGFFANTVVLRAKVARGDTFRSLIGKTKECAISAFTHQFFPFEKVVETLSPERHLDRNPVVQVLFNLLDEEMLLLRLEGLDVREIERAARSTPFDVSLQVVRRDGRYALSWTYRSALFARTTIEAMAHHFEVLLRGAIDAPQAESDALALLPAAERDELRHALASPAVPMPERLTVVDLIAHRAVSHPDEPAVISDDDILTYGELDRYSSEFAGELLKGGVGVGDRVGVSVARSASLVVVLLGVLKAGACYVPLDPGYPAERLAFIAEDAKIRFFVGAETLPPGVLRRDSIRVATVFGTSASVAAKRPPLSPHATAYVIYTSGSTGRPKGVVVSHHALVNFLLGMASDVSASSTDSLLAVTSISFDIAGLELFLPLVLGGRVVVASAEDAADGDRLHALVRDNHITILQATPTTWRLLLRAGWSTPLTALCGGEALPQQLADEITAVTSTMFNVYGPTETTIWSSVAKLAHGDSVHLGRPIANTELYVVDAFLEPVPRGVVGELCIGGLGVADGYLARPDLTADRFVVDALSGRPGARLYRTGDLVRQNRARQLEFVGRVDHQVKVRGHRIELGEIEKSLAGHPSLAQVAVVVAKDASGADQLVAYCKARSEHEVARGELREYLARFLPPYMVPAHFVAISEFPLTPNGKLDRSALAARPVSGQSSDATPLTTATEVQLAEIWSELLGAVEIGARDDFFGLGGHSLLATTLVQRIRKDFQIDIPLRTLFEQSTLGGQAESIDEMRRDALVAPIASRSVSVSVRPIAPSYIPLSPPQRRTWFVERVHPGTRAYVVAGEVRLSGELDDARFARAIREAARRHDAFSISFEEDDGVPKQHVAPTVELQVPFHDLRGIAEAEALLAIHRRDVCAPFDLSIAPLVRCALVRLADDQHVFLFAMHHIVGDAWSLGVFLREVSALYRALTAGAPTILVAPLQFAEFVEWHTGFLQSASAAKQLEYWRETLEAAPARLDLPRRRGDTTSLDGKRIPVRFERPTIEGVRAFARARGVTPFMVVLSALGVVLARHSRQNDIVVGTPVANRHYPDAESVIGYLANVVPLRLRIRDAWSIDELVKRVRDVVVAAMVNQDIPFDRIVEVAKVAREPDTSPLVQVMLSWNEEEQTAEFAPGVRLEIQPLDPESARLELVLQLYDRGDFVDGFLEFQTAAFLESVVSLVAYELPLVLAFAIDHSDASVGAIPLVTDEERTREVIQANAGRAWRSSAPFVHESIAQAAAATPARVALWSATDKVSYGELLMRSRAGAVELRKRGVGPDQVVGVFADRSASSIVGALSVLFAGGAFLFLDTSLPDDRLRVMVEVTGCRLVVGAERVRSRLGAIEGLDLDGAPAPLAHQVASLPEVSDGLLAYVNFTSGSTGEPKGVMVPHGALRESIERIRRAYGVTAESQVLQFASPSFDASIEELFKALTCGATLHVAQKEELLGEELVQFLASRRVDNATLPPQILAQLDPSRVPDLVRVTSAGDTLDAATSDRWVGEGRVLTNAYGPTETTVAATASLSVLGRVPDIGIALPGVRVYVLTPDLEVLPRGVAGELFIAGPSVARGYSGRPGWTAERFLPDPFASQPGERMYRTGDLVRRQDDDSLAFLGRVDRQIKLRGHRIELGEIEMCLSALPGVTEAAVVLLESGSRRLAAFVVAPELSQPSLLVALRSALPEYMVPTHLELRASLPKTASGKLDRARLSSDAISNVGVTEQYRAPSGATEVALASIWEEILGVRAPSVDANFFTLGGDSIVAVQVASRATRAGLEMRVRDLFAHPTIARLAAAVGEGSGVAGSASRVADRTTYPLTAIQRWFLSRGVSHAHHYNQGIVLDVRVDVHAERLRGAVEQLIHRHDALRSEFTVVDGEWRASVASTLAGAWWSTFDIKGVPAPKVELALASLGTRIHMAFDLGVAPLFRAALIQTLAGPKLLLAAHHLVVDGVSWRVLIDDLEALYDARDPASLGAASSIIDAAADLEAVRSDALSVTWGPWLRHDADGASPIFAMVDTHGESLAIRTELSADGTRSLLSRPGAIGAALSLACAKVVAALAGVATLGVDIEAHGRDVDVSSDLSRAVGWFTVLLPLRFDESVLGGELALALSRVESMQRDLPGPLGQLGLCLWLKRFAAAPLLVNYMGQLDAGFRKTRLLTPSTLSSGDAVHGTSPRTHVFEVNASVVDGRLGIEWRGPGAMVAELAELAARSLDLVELLARSVAQGGAANVVESTDVLADAHAVAEKCGIPLDEIAVCAPLTALQEGLLFHSLHTADPETYVVQIRAKLEGQLDAARFRECWAALVERHSALRTTIHWKGVARPVQVVRRHVTPAFELVDFANEGDAASEIGRIAATHRGSFSDLSVPPLHRVLLARTGPRSHELVLTVHHTILDGWSFGVLMAELFALHEGLDVTMLGASEGTVDAVRPGRASNVDEAFFRGMFRGCRGPTEIPKVPSLGAGGHATETARLPKEAADLIVRAARSLGVTTSALFCAAWGLALSRAAGEDEAIFGVVLSGRASARSGAERAVGLFVNTLPLRVDVDPDESVVDFVRRTHERAGALAEHEHVPLTDVHGWSGFEPQQALFDALLVVENYPVPEHLARADAPLRVTDVQFFDHTTYALTLSISLRDGVLFELGYDTKKYDDAFGMAILRSMVVAVTELASRRDERTALVELATVPSFAEHIAPPTRWKRLDDAFFDVASSAPNDIAIVGTHDSATYQHLQRRALEVRAVLIERGVTDEELVGVLLDRSIDFVVSVLGILAAGAAWHPLLPSHPQGYLEARVRDARTRYVLTTAEHAALARSLGCEPILVDELGPCVASVIPSVSGGFDGMRLAYALYTSGSTGKPKGVMVSHGSLLGHVQATSALVALDRNDVFLQSTTLEFDVSTWELFAPLLSGARLVLLPSGPLDVAVLVRTAVREGVSALQCSPQLLEAILEVPQVFEWTTLRLIFCGGEAMPLALPAKVAAVWANVALFNAYGPTEATIDALCQRTGATESGDRVPLGVPIAGVVVRVLTPRLGAVSRGLPGELFVGGNGVARGYLGAPDRTAERFVPDPFSESSGARMYRTGDLARMRDDGVVEFLGRVDEQLKIRGIRIEPGEVEAALLRHPQVRSGVVLPLATHRGDLDLFCWFVSDGSVGARDLEAFLATQLPAALVPHRYAELPSLPLSANGKVDRRALQALRPTTVEGAVTAARTATERLLVEIWKDVLTISEVGVDDDFFRIGGQSLLAMRVLSRIREDLGYGPPLRVLLEKRTIAELASAIDDLGTSDSPRVLRGAVPIADRTAPIPASWAQEQLWFLEHIEPGTQRISSVHRVSGTLDVGALERAVNAVVARHESLRMVFTEQDGVIRQRPSEATACFEVTDLPAADANALTETWVREFEGRSFDLEHGPILRCGIARGASDESVLCISVHHIAVDGWSLSLLAHEVGAEYRAIVAGEASSLSNVDAHYVDWFRWWQSWLEESGELEAQRAYWKGALSGAPPVLELPLDRSRRPGQSRAAKLLTRSLGPARTDALEAFGRRTGATLFSVLLAAYALLLRRTTGQDEVVVGTPVANRPTVESERIVGLLVNMVPLRIAVDLRKTASQHVGVVADVCTEAFSRRDVPFARVVDTLNLSRDLAHAPVFQTVLSLQNMAPPALDLGGPRVAPIVFAKTAIEHDLVLDFVKHEGELTVSAMYASALLDEGTVAAMLERFLEVCDFLTRSPDLPLSASSFVSAGEYATLRGFEHGPRPARSNEEATIVDLFDLAADRHPTRVALHCDGTTVTYEELAHSSSRVARELSRRGVGAATPVGLFVDRSIQSVVLSLAVLRAGAAFMPLDPTYPMERLRFVLDDSRARVIVASRRRMAELPETAAHVVELEALFSAASDGEGISGERCHPDSPAYLVYTSGSTGKPKGVFGTHRAIVNRIEWMASEFPFEADDVVAHKTALNFVDAIWEVYGPLTGGARVEIISDAVMQAPEDLVSVIEDRKVSRIVLVPSLLWTLLESVPDADKRLAGLRIVTSSGEALTRELATAFFEALPETKLLNLYGCSEVAADSTFHLVSPGATVAVPLGKPIDWTDVFVLDDDLQRVPPGFPGELYVAGRGLALGYFGRSDLTAERFLPNPFASDPGDRIYRTGDVVRFLPDGSLEYRGRRDHQVKIRGVRVELAEVEAVLRAHPDVYQALVVTTNAHGELSLVAYVVPRQGRGLSSDDLKGTLRVLPLQARPKHVVVLDALPLTPNGKVDRTRLPAVQAPLLEIVAPDGATEVLLETIVREILGVENVGVTSDFFDLGGHSLHAMRVASRIRQTFGSTFSTRDVFDKRTVRAFAELLRDATPGDVLDAIAETVIAVASMSDADVKAMLQ